VGLLEVCSEDHLRPLLASADLVTLPAGTLIERAGSTARQFVGIVEGYVRCVDGDGDAVVLGPGDHIGATELVEDRPHVRTTTTCTTATLVVVFGPAFRAAARSLPGLMLHARAARRTGGWPTIEARPLVGARA